MAVPVEGLMHQEFALARATSLASRASSSAGVALTSVEQLIILIRSI